MDSRTDYDDVSVLSCVFLDRMERIRQTGEDLPLPSVMRRINYLLQTLLPGDRSHHSEERERGTTRSSCTEIERFRSAIDSIDSVTTPVYIDLLTLPSTRGSVIKEFSAYSAGAKIACVTVKPPPNSIPLRPEVEHFVERLHGIKWEIGVLDVIGLQRMVSTLFCRKRRVYVKGLHITDLLRKHFDTSLVEIEELDAYPGLRYLSKSFQTPPCPFHMHLKTYYSCAMKHTRAMEKYQETMVSRGGKRPLVREEEEEEDNDDDRYGPIDHEGKNRQTSASGESGEDRPPAREQEDGRDGPIDCGESGAERPSMREQGVSGRDGPSDHGDKQGRAVLVSGEGKEERPSVRERGEDGRDESTEHEERRRRVVLVSVGGVEERTTVGEQEEDGCDRPTDHGEQKGRAVLVSGGGGEQIPSIREREDVRGCDGTKDHEEKQRQPRVS